MKTAKTTLLMTGLLCCVTLNSLYAVCVTPAQLTKGVHDLITNTYYSTAHPSDNMDFVASLFRGKASPAFTGLAPNSPALSPTDIASQWTTLNGDQANWQKKEPPMVTAVPVTDAAELKKMNDHFELMQKWANYGELVIVITNTGAGTDTRVAIVVPDTANQMNVGANKWAQIKVPRIAAIGTLPTNSTAPGAVGAPYTNENGAMTDMFADPSLITFFRYKN